MSSLSIRSRSASQPAHAANAAREVSKAEMRCLMILIASAVEAAVADDDVADVADVGGEDGHGEEGEAENVWEVVDAVPLCLLLAPRCESAFGAAQR